MSSQSTNDQLRTIIERIEKLNEEKDEVAELIKQVYLEAKGNGFDTNAIRKVVALRKLDSNKRQEQQTVLETYMLALGMEV